MEDIKKVMQTVIDNFTREEQGNRVTVNNMMALAIKVNMVLDGKITLTPPNQDKDADEKTSDQ
jgi:hypothetical protein